MRLRLFVMAVALGAHVSSGKEITLRDYSSRGFAPDVVKYRIEKGMTVPKSLIDDEGKAIPVQVLAADLEGDEPLLAFVTDLPPSATRSFRAGSSEAPHPRGLGWTVKGESAHMSNGLFSVKVPAPGVHSLTQPVRLSDIPPPLLGFRGGDTGFFRGSAQWLADDLVSSWSVKVVDDGPVMVAIAYEVILASGGYYRARIEVADRLPLARITEEYDLGTLKENLIWEFQLNEGWKPDKIESMRALGNGLYGTKTESLKSFLATQVAAGGGGYGTGGSNSQPGVVEESRSHVCRRLVPDSGWSGDMVSYFGVWQGDIGASSDSPPLMAGIVPLNKGYWRRPNAWDIANENGRMVVRIPVGVVPQSWLREITSDTSPFSMHEHDPALPTTYGRRVWGLQLAPVKMEFSSIHGDGPFYRAKAFYGIVGLDRYKDFVLDWPDSSPAYPRVFIRPNELARFRETWQSSPLEAGLRRYSSLTGDEATARQNTETAIKQVRGNIDYMLTTPAMGHHHTYTWVAALADDALSWNQMPSASRAELRALLALKNYLYVEPDVNSAGGGQHHGNPNMALARLSDRSNFLALLPDHPAFPTWRDYGADWLAYKLGAFTAPGGGWMEFGGAYHAHGFARASRGVFGFLGTELSRLGDLLEYVSPNWNYYMNLLTPYDNRYYARMIPGGANSPPGYTENFVEAVGVFAEANPAFAGHLRWAWEVNGSTKRNFNENFVAIMDRPWITPQEPSLGSLLVPGVGVIFRAHQGPMETYMYLRSGFQWSHWYEDQGHFIIHSRGAALVPGQPYQYYGIDDTSFDLYNTIRFGDPSNKYDFGWPDSNIVEHSFGESIDYAWSSSGYPDWFIRPGKARNFGHALPLANIPGQKEGRFNWNRQVIFIKGRTAESPNYFVFRDTMPNGGLASWLNLNLIGDQGSFRRSGPEFRVETEWPVGFDLIFAQGGEGVLDTLEDRTYLAAESDAHGKHLPQRWKSTPDDISKNWVRRDSQSVDVLGGKPPDAEKHVLLRLANGPGQEYFWVLYPRTKEEVAPKIEHLSRGVIRIRTPEGIDTVFLSPEKFEYQGPEIKFKGSVGAVREGTDGSVVLACLGSAGGQLLVRGSGFSGGSPFEKRIAAPGDEKGIVAVSPPAVTEPPSITALPGGGTRFRHAGPHYVELIKGNKAVRGCGPFDLILSEDSILGSVDGTMRTISATAPARLVRPMFWLDGKNWAAGIPDDSSPHREVDSPQLSMAFAVTGGPQVVRVGEWQWPRLPPAPPRKVLWKP